MITLFNSINKKFQIFHFMTLILLSLLVFISLITIPNYSYAQQVYQMPPKAIADLVDAPPTPSMDFSPDNQWMLIMDHPSLPSIEEVSQPELRIAGIRINPRTNGPSRARYYTKLTLKNIRDGKQIAIELPENAQISNIRWSPNGEFIAFTLTKVQGIELWLAEVSSGKAKKLLDSYVNDTYGGPFFWVSDNQTLICLTVPIDRGDAPVAPTVPQGPVIQENIGKKAPARTYQDLLKNPYDESLFEYYTTSQIIRVRINGETTSIGSPAIFTTSQPSPDGKYLLVETIYRPYSYLVPAYRFPQKIEIWDLYGNIVHEVADLPLAEEIPVGFGAVRTGPRSINWRADKPATLYWVEAQDDGDPKKEVEIRDKVFMLSAPFKGKPTPLISLGLRYDEIMWGDEKLAIATEYWWKTRKVRSWLIQPGKPKAKPELLFDRSFEDRYSDPGNPIFKRTKFGTSILLTSNKGKSIFLSGAGASPEGDKPFMDQLDLKSLTTKRLWQSQAPHYEYFVTFLDEKGDQFITRRETVTEPPNYYIKNLKTNDLKQMTFFPHPTPQLKDVKKEIIQYKRDDGVDLMATLYLPPDYSPEKDGPLPILMWAYPREFKSVKAAGQMRGSPYQFVRIGSTSHMLLLTQGYAILDGPTMPIIGEGDKEPNDTYIEQLVASAKAAVDEVVRRGVADRDRIAIGGHSYGAFMTANLLAHSDLYRTGIARSGAYNRTLTPFGFQAEERTFWEAPEIYFTMSPFMHANKVNEPILLIHGEADNNSGTFPIQSERYYHALKGHGATARLVMLPHESHGYRARESMMHVFWEMTQWLDKYVKNAPPRNEEN
jgi:dipeptidyl aminopeptidase/acylaminoacyl peptidase